MPFRIAAPTARQAKPSPGIPITFVPKTSARQRSCRWPSRFRIPLPSLIKIITAWRLSFLLFLPRGPLRIPFVNADGTGLIPAGQLIFGVGTESNNALGSATLYALDSNGNFPQVVYNGLTYTSGGSVNSALNALYLANPLTLGVQNCTDNTYYCPSSTTPVSLTTYGVNGTSGSATVNIANADSLFTNTDFSAFNDLAQETIGGLLTDQFDLGLPFFFGRSLFVGIAGTTIPNNVSAPNGYVAF